MDSLSGAVVAGERLKQTAMRDFGPAPEARAADVPGTSFRLAFGPREAPVPALLKYTLNLIGLKAYGPGEKVAWWVNFTYKGEWCELAHEKFGVRLYLWTEVPEGEARKTLVRQPPFGL